MKRGIIALSILLFTQVAFAAECSTDGATIVYVNGILTSQDQAEFDRGKVEDNFIANAAPFPGLVVKLAYNPSHLGGAGDLLKATMQAYQGSEDGVVDDYDLRSMLIQLHGELTTQRVLLVGHSQGAFYANALREYLTTHGMSTSAVSVYQTGSPASFVSGEGMYTTSETDKVINAVREATAHGGAKAPLPANVRIALTPAEEEERWSGHSLAGVYLTRANVHIAQGMFVALAGLASESVATVSEGCFTLPQAGVTHAMQTAFFTVADPLALGVRETGDAAVSEVRTTLAGAWETTKSAIPLLRVTEFKDEKEMASTLFPVVKALYGSSMSSAGVNDLMYSDVEAEQTFTNLIDPGGVRLGGQYAAAVLATSAIVPEEPSAPQPTPQAPPVVAPAVADAVLIPEPQQEESVVIEQPATTSVVVVEEEELEQIAQQEEEAVVEQDTPPNPFAVNLQFGSGMGGGGGGGSAAPAPVGDTTAPTLNLTITGCLAETPTTCTAVTGSELTYAWNVTDNDSVSEVTLNSATTTKSGSATTTAADMTLTLAATDTTGNSATRTVEVTSTLPQVVINEVAWGGTQDNPNDEWFELYNTGSDTIALDGWQLEGVDSGLAIALGGTIAPGEYFLVESSEEATSEPVDYVTAFGTGLIDTGETLQLTAYGVTIDELTEKGGMWRGGQAGSSAASLERFIPTEPSDDDTNWYTAYLDNTNGTNRDGAALQATPGARNSINYLFTYNHQFPSGSDTLIIDDSRAPYKMQWFTVPAGKTLELANSGEITILDDDSLYINGTLNASGVTLQGAEAVAGAWRGVQAASGATVALEDATIAYAATGISAEDATVSLDRVTVRNSAGNGATLSGGVFAATECTFTKNDTGIYHDNNADVTITDSLFTDNADIALIHQSFTPAVYRDNSGDGNGVNGIFLGTSWRGLNSSGTTVLAYNELPYVLSWLEVKSGMTLALDAGVTIKGTHDGSLWGKSKIVIADGGTLQSNGTESNPVIFTALTDPDDSPQEGDWWGIVTEGSGAVTGASTSTAEIRYADPTTPVPW